MFKGTWKTRVGALLGIVIAAIQLLAIPLLDSDQVTVAQWGLFTVAVTLGLGLFFARDNDVTSEQAGLKGKDHGHS